MSSTAAVTSADHLKGPLEQRPEHDWPWWYRGNKGPEELADHLIKCGAWCGDFAIGDGLVTTGGTFSRKKQKKVYYLACVVELGSVNQFTIGVEDDGKVGLKIPKNTDLFVSVDQLVEHYQTNAFETGEYLVTLGVEEPSKARQVTVKKFEGDKGLKGIGVSMDNKRTSICRQPWIFLKRVDSSSEAYKQGVGAGDRILAIDGIPMVSDMFRDAVSVCTNLKQGDSITMVIRPKDFLPARPLTEEEKLEKLRKDQEFELMQDPAYAEMLRMKEETERQMAALMIASTSKEDSSETIEAKQLRDARRAERQELEANRMKTLRRKTTGSWDGVEGEADVPEPRLEVQPEHDDIEDMYDDDDMYD